MKTRKHLPTFLISELILSMLFFCFAQPTFGQEKVNVSAGIGLPDWVYVGVRYQDKQVQTGLNFGILPIKNNNLMSISLDVFYHFGGSSRLSSRRPWYVKTGLLFLRNETNVEINKFIYLTLRVGRDFNISKKIGLQFDVGPIFELMKGTRIKKPSSGSWGTIGSPVLPSLSFGVFYRI